MGVKVHVIFYSMYGHVYRMAEAVLAGVKEVAGAEASLFQVAELAQDAVLEKSGARAARAAFAHVPVATMDSLAEPHGIFSIRPAGCGPKVR
jgi:NAD(P)H dehydrogenase (quinone)